MQKAHVLALAVLVGLAVYLPNIWQQNDARYQGIPVQLNTDEHAYLIHQQETLLGRFGQGGKGIIAAYYDEPSFVFTPIEEVYGVLFGWTGISAAKLFQIMDFIIPFLLVLVMYMCNRSLGFNKRTSLIITTLWCSFELYHLGRPINQRASFLMMLLTIWSFASVLNGNRSARWYAGALMGALVGVYLWGWLAVWCVWGLIGLLVLSNCDWPRVRRFTEIGVIGALFASPSFYHIYAIQSHPAYADAMERTGIRAWNLPESWPWSICTLVMAITTTIIWYRRGKKTEELGIAAVALSAFILLNQHMIHGVEILFRNHYLMWIGWSALLTGAYILRYWKRSLVMMYGLICSALIVGALYTENAYYLNQWKRTEERFEEQHLASALPILEALDTTTILSDSYTTGFLLSHTKHYGVYSEYLFQAYLVPHTELAERYCVSEYPLPGELKRDPRILNWNIQLDPTLREEFHTRQDSIVSTACALVKTDMAERLKSYDVEYLFWDEKRQPEWDPTDYRVDLDLVEQEEGWSLWIMND